MTGDIYLSTCRKSPAMDHVLHQMQESSSFQSGTSREKQNELQGAANMASQDLTDAAGVPDRDGGSTASTSDSDDV